MYKIKGVPFVFDWHNDTEGGHSLIWPIRGRAAGQGMVFGLLCPEQGIQFYANRSEPVQNRVCLGGGGGGSSSPKLRLTLFCRDTKLHPRFV